MSKVAIYNWAGHGNWGDELILEGLKHLFKDWKITVFSNDTKGVYPLIDFDVVNKCDLFVLGGGELIMRSCLFSQLPSIFDYNYWLSYVYRKTPFSKWSWIHRVKIPKIVLGCGVNAQDAGELSQWCIDGLNQFDYIGLRDNVAVNILKSFPQFRSKVGLSYDLAFSAETPELLQKKKDYVVVVPTDRFCFGDAGVQENNIAVKSIPWLKEMLQGFSRVVFLAFGEQDNNDYKTCQILSNEFVGSEVVCSKELCPSDVWGLIAGATKVFPYRLHGLIMSYITGVPYEFYPYHWKLQRVHDTIKGCSLESIRERQRQCVDAALWHGGLVE